MTKKANSMPGRLPAGFLCFTLFLMIFIFAPFTTLADNNISKSNSIMELVQTAEQNGSARIIIQFAVPNLSKLTDASTSQQVTIPGVDTSDATISADLELSDAILNTSHIILSKLDAYEYNINRLFRTIPFMALDVSPEALLLLGELPEVLGIGEDKPIKLILPEGRSVSTENSSDLSDDPDSPQLNNTAGIIGADTAWGMGYTGTGWYVAVLDSGIRRTHNFFAGKTILEACYSLDAHCPGGVTSKTGTGSAVHHPSSYAGWDHGTHVAGIATGNNGSLFGIAKDSNIVAVQVFSRFADCYADPGDQPCVMSYTSDQVYGLEYVYSIRGSYSIASVNMSLGGGQYTSDCDAVAASRKTAIDNLRAAGIATVIATGNDGYCTPTPAISRPACISTAVAVGSSTDGDARSSFSNWHSTLQDLFAPGSSIYSSAGDTDSTYQSWSGTSMATPHVAGAWALIKQAKTTATVTEVLNALESTGTPITSVCDGYTTPIPRINVDSAINTLASSITVQTPNGGESWYKGTIQTVSWNAVGTTSTFKLTLWNGGTNLGTIKKKSAGNGLRSFSWTVGRLLDGTTAFPGAGYTIKVKEQGTAVSDFSDSSFTITGPPEIRVVTPNGGETLTHGAIHLVQWKAHGTTGTFKVTLWKNGVNLGNIKKKSAGNGLRSFSWTVGRLLDGTYVSAGSGYTIKVKEQGTAVADTSDSGFTINN